MFLEEVCRVINMYKGIEDSIGVDDQTIPGVNCPKGKAVLGVAFCVGMVTTCEMETW